MKRLEREARALVDGYLDRVRLALTDCPSVDVVDIEGDVRDHIERELESAAEPVTASAVSRVLKQLGSPRQWAPDGELNEWQRFALRLYSGPEDWRLSYLSFGLLLVALSFEPMLAAGALGAFVAARASVSASRLRGDTAGAQRWFSYPALLAAYLPLAAIILCWPAAALRFTADLVVNVEASRPGAPAGLLALAERIYAVRFTGFDVHETPRALLNVLHYFVAAVGAWWFVLGAALATAPRSARALFRPFLDRGLRTVGVTLAATGALMVCVGLVRAVIKII